MAYSSEISGRYNLQKRNISDKRVYGQFCIETLHESRKQNSSGLAYLNRKTKCQNYSKISRN